MASPAINIIEFTTEPQLLGLGLSAAQETLLRAVYGLSLNDDQLDLWRASTGRERYPVRAFGEVTVLAGARSGKDSRIAAPVALYEAFFGGHSEQLSKGERAVIPVVAQDHRATRIAYGYIRDYLTSSSILSTQVAEIRSLEIELTNRVTIICFPCTLRSLRGWSIPVGILDEVGFWRLEGQADSDVEVQASVRRGMLAFDSPRLVKISTPYMRSGVLYEDFRQSFGQDDPDRLVWKASSELMNPSLREERLERERRLDPTRFAREYEAEFQEGLEAFLLADWVEDAVVQGRRELPPVSGTTYVGAVDPSGGGRDAFTLATVHSDWDGQALRVVQDVMRGWGRRSGRNVDLDGVVSEISEILRHYGLSSVLGDRYGAGWVRERFQAHGMRYEPSELDKSSAYVETEPLFSTGRIELLDHRELSRELRNLERRPRVGGKPLVDHPRGGHDDYANALALAASIAARAEGGGFPRELVDAALSRDVQPLFGTREG